jgi:hypothetical protein
LNRSRSVTITRRVLALVAIVFGVMTLIAGTRIFGGADPGYMVFRPLLIYNTAMGLAYVAAGVIAWRSAMKGKRVAAVIFLLNLLVLGGVAYLYQTGSGIAVQSVGAMTFRTVVWLLLYLGLVWVSRRSDDFGFGRGA